MWNVIPVGSRSTCPKSGWWTRGDPPLFEISRDACDFPGGPTVSYSNQKEHPPGEKKLFVDSSIPSVAYPPSEEFHVSADSLDSPVSNSLVLILLSSSPSGSPGSVNPRPALQLQRSEFFPSWLPARDIRLRATTCSFVPRPIADHPYPSR